MDPFGIGVGAVVGIGGEQTVVRALGGRIGSGLVVVVQEVVRAALSSIGTFATVVVDDVVEEFYFLLLGLAGVAAAAEAGRAVGVVGQQIVMERGGLSSPDAAVAVCTFFVYGVGQTFADDAPLQGQVTVVVERATLVGAPAQRTVVDDDVAVRLIGIHGVVAFLHDVGSHTRADKADDDVVGLYIERIVLQADAVARCGLSGDGQIAVAHLERLLQFDDAADGKDDGAGSLLVDGPAQGALRTVVLERRYGVNGSACPSGGVFACSVGTGKGRDGGAVGRGIGGQCFLVGRGLRSCLGAVSVGASQAERGK